ncbi:MAG: S9 family peptidase [Cyanothece sp. SIO1E1]|nr:S9 family peptidase [Cyanothece sp. SIO1E1]
MTPSAIAQVTWQDPPEPIAAMLDAPRNPAVFISPNNQWMIEFERSPLPPLSDLAEPGVAIAGIEINPQTREPRRSSYYHGMAIRKLGSDQATPVILPPNPRIRNLRWSPDSKRLAFTLTLAEGIELWVLDMASAKAQRLTEPVLNAVYGNPCRWLPGDQGLICKLVPTTLESPPVAPLVPAGPSVEENLGRTAPARTYTNLLQGPHDEALFEHYFQSVLAHVSLTGDRTLLSPPALINRASPSPDGQWILLSTFHRPFSYQVPLSRFPIRIEVLDRSGQPVYQIADLPLADDIPIAFDAVRQGRRQVGWRADQAATLYWVEALDQGNPQQDVPWRDRVQTLAAPFTGEPQLLWQSALRFRGITWGHRALALVRELWYDTRKLRIWQINPADSTVAPKLFNERNFQDAYSHPGDPITAPGPFGWQTLLLSPDGESLYLNGKGASPDGVFPFLDQFNLKTGEQKRIWQAQAPYYERVEQLLDNQAQQFITRQQSQTEPPNYWLRQAGAEPGMPLTQVTDPLPWYSNVSKELVRYQREDGVELSATLYLPPNYSPTQDGPLPTLLWAYPEEHKSRETANQITVSENTFSRPTRTSVLFLLTQGYAVLSGPTMPIIGEADAEPNDTYVEQLVASAQAAVDYLVARGIADRDRLAIGGHSYGAFTAANLLAHSDLFRAGIAYSGAYNRSLTPFGFQGEQRNFWDATDTYIQISPFTHAADIKAPLLLVHGADDNNLGTYPIQSERLYEAMRGLGGTVRWVSLPFEGHGYRSREAVGHVLWEMVQWLDRYIKNVPSRH